MIESEVRLAKINRRKARAWWRANGLNILGGGLMLLGSLCLLACVSGKLEPVPDPMFAAPDAWPAVSPFGLNTPARIVEVTDGDSVKVEIRIVASVRLLECWSKELNTDAGKQAKQHLLGLAPVGKPCSLYVPFRSNDLGGAFSFGRLLGYVTVEGQDKSLSEIQCADGFAVRKKPR